MNSKQSEFIENVKTQLTLMLENPNIKILNGDCDIINRVEICYFDGMGEYVHNAVKTINFSITYKVGDKDENNS